MKRLALAAALVLSGCGVDGPPRVPQAAPTGVTVTGEARMGAVFAP